MYDSELSQPSTNGTHAAAGDSSITSPAEEVPATAPDLMGAIHLLEYSWRQVEETTVQNCFKRAGFNVCAGDGDDASSTVDQTSDIVDEACETLFTEVLERQGVTEGISFPDFRDIDSEVQTSPDTSDEAIVASVVEVSPNESDGDDTECESADDSDQGANIISALRPYARMNCCAHVLNTVLRNAFDDRYLAQELPDLLEQLQKVKAVVTFLKQSGLTSQLPHGVCQEICTRWNSKLAMIKSVLSQYDVIENLLDSRGNLLLEDVNKTLLTEVAEFLEPFKEVSEKLEQDKVVTLPLVLMYYTKLKKHLTADSTDSPEVCQLKSRTLEFLPIKLPIEELHKVATFLWPPFRHLRVLDEQERKSVHDRVRELLIDVHLRLPQGETSTDHPDYEPPTKRTSLDEFKEWRDAAETQPADSELDSYLRDSDSCEDIEKLLECSTVKSLRGRAAAMRAGARERLGSDSSTAASGEFCSLSSAPYDRTSKIHGNNWGMSAKQIRDNERGLQMPQRARQAGRPQANPKHQLNMERPRPVYTKGGDSGLRTSLQQPIMKFNLKRVVWHTSFDSRRDSPVGIWSY
ncbi:hypothetical protein HPB50_008673 [Hyalomma asiaticum]|uniref:Uncharacterized protein n=1 Tax=Hyalomma asiaticum TaxID=266040 RepID=A0ACB7SKQ0_HYAAI|nr:hypothetical protein HPB50_008673 [Hyalomma asiaticum]